LAGAAKTTGEADSYRYEHRPLREACVSTASYASYWALCLLQGLLVAVPPALRWPWLATLRRRWPLIVGPAAAATAAFFFPSVASELADELSTLALFAVPVLAGVALVWIYPPHPVLGSVVAAVLLAVAWIGVGSTTGDAAALVLAALSAVAVAMAVAAVVPALGVKIGICVWAAVDLSTALGHKLAEASRPIMQAAPAVGPHLQFQRVVLGSASMEWADLFVAAMLGAVLAAQGRRKGFASVLVAVLAISSSSFFLITNVLPATVPVAVALVVEEARARLAEARSLVSSGSARAARRAT
jgi:hypothetical protein